MIQILNCCIILPILKFYHILFPTSTLNPPLRWDQYNPEVPAETFGTQTEGLIQAWIT